jgi:hypothetical protein
MLFIHDYALNTLTDLYFLLLAHKAQMLCK